MNKKHKDPMDEVEEVIQKIRILRKGTAVWADHEGNIPKARHRTPDEKEKLRNLVKKLEELTNQIKKEEGIP